MSTKPATRATRSKNPPSVPPPSTRSTRARTAAVKDAPDVPAPITTKKPAARKPLASKDNTTASINPPNKSKSTSTRKVANKLADVTADPQREPIMAYLRIRPRIGLEESSSRPYLTPLSDTTVNMTDPQNPQDGRSKYRFSSVPPSSLYTFTHVFLPNTNQSEFFTKTTLPLVQDVLTGQNGLLFTYGVTNSGKTYTVQGGVDEGAAGILPRSLDVIFNSIEGLHGNRRYRPVRLHGIEPADDGDFREPLTTSEPALDDVLRSFDSIPETQFDVDSTVVQVDRNYEYTIWISYAEVYNEKVYDLLASVKNESNVNPEPTPRSGGVGKPLLLTRQALPLRPSPATDSMDLDSQGKYIAGLRQFCVQTASQAKELVRLGQLHRRVFGTLANRESSRSHGMVIIKIVRGHRGEKDNPTALQISRLTLVDLAGSERTKHTHTTGERLKEAGNINKSLMVLGQCMEVMRLNQRKIAMSLSCDATKDGRIDTRDVKKGLAIVPFRHSKLTEALMDYFVGDGRTVMIVNVNPYDTGYDENSHVMKFAALAREVYVTPAPAPRVPVVGPGNLQGKKIKQLGPLTLNDPDVIPHPYTRKVTISLDREIGKKGIEAILEVREDDELVEETNDQDEDPINPLVDALFDEVEHLRLKLFESEMRCAMIEAETREEVMKEMEDRMRAMEELYSRRLMSELEQNELKTDAKIDMLHQSGLFGGPSKDNRRPCEDSEEEDVEISLISYGEENERSISTSPLTSKSKRQKKSAFVPQPVIEKRLLFPDPPMLPSDNEEAELTDDNEDEQTSIGPSITTASIMEDEDGTQDGEDEENGTEDEEDESEDEWASHQKTPRAMKQKTLPVNFMKSQKQGGSKSSSKNPRISTLTRNFNDLQVSENEEDDDDDSAVILPTKKSRTPAGKSGNQKEDEFDPPVVKKKKRQIGKQPATRY